MKNPFAETPSPQLGKMKLITEIGLEIHQQGLNLENLRTINVLIDEELATRNSKGHILGS